MSTHVKRSKLLQPFNTFALFAICLTALSILGLVMVFSVSVGWAWHMGLDISCGCHGGNAPIQYWNKVAEFVGYFIVLGGLWWMENWNDLATAKQNESL